MSDSKTQDTSSRAPAPSPGPAPQPGQPGESGPNDRFSPDKVAFLSWIDSDLELPILGSASSSSASSASTTTTTTTASNIGMMTPTATVTTTAPTASTPSAPAVLPSPLASPPRSPQMHAAINKRLMSFDELVTKIGQVPREDKTAKTPFGTVTLKKMSTKYKAIDTAIADMAASQQMKAGSLDNAGWQTLERQLDGKLGAVLDKAGTYRKGKTSTKKAAIDDLVTTATDARTALPALIAAVRNDSDFDSVKDHLTAEQALEAKRLGVNFADCKFDLYNNSKLNVGQSRTNVGAGKMNSVSKLVHADGVARMFKPEQASDAGGAMVSGNLGIDPKAPHFGNRNIASKAIADVLGTKVIPDACFGLHDGRIGLLMAKAPGKAPLGDVTRPVNPDPWFRTELEKAEGDGKSPPDYTFLEGKGYQKKPDGSWERTTKEGTKPWSTPPSDAAQASLHAQLNQLEWCDLMTGQADRSSENVMIEIVGDQVTVTGIDNDLAFGEKSTDAAAAAQTPGATSIGVPTLIDRATFDRIVAINFDRDLLPRLSGLLTKAEIHASKQRCADVQNHARRLEKLNMVVDDWASWTAPGTQLSASQFLAAQKPNSSIFKRDLAGFFKQDKLL